MHESLERIYRKLETSEPFNSDDVLILMARIDSLNNQYNYKTIADLIWRVSNGIDEKVAWRKAEELAIQFIDDEIFGGNE